MDRATVDLAAERGLPLVSSEGHSADGINERKLIRRYARERGVQVMIPREYYAGRLNEEEAIARFLDRFGREAPRYLALPDTRAGWRDWLLTLHGYFRLVLNGELAGTDERLPVHLPSSV